MDLARGGVGRADAAGGGAWRHDSQLSESRRKWFISEYGPAEILSALLFAACSLLAVLMLRRHWRAIPGLYRAALVVLVV